MTDIAKTINDFISERLATGLILNDEFAEPESEGVISRHDPSQAKSKTYIDGSEEGSLNIAYWARFKNAKTARKILNDILNLVDDETIESENITIDIEAVSLPQFVSTNDKGLTLYACSIRASYQR